MRYQIRASRDGAVVFEGAAASTHEAVEMARYANSLDQVTVTVSDPKGQELSAAEFAVATDRVAATSG